MLITRLKEELGSRYIYKMMKVFPFIESDEDIEDFFNANHSFNDIPLSKWAEWVRFRVENEYNKVYRIIPSMSDVQKVYPNVKTTQDRDIVVSQFVGDNFRVKKFMHEGYLIFTRSDYRLYSEAFHRHLKEMMR